MPLFTKLREIKTQDIQGVPLVDSDDEQADLPLDLTPIIEQLMTYKKAQAREVVKIHKNTKKGIK